MATKITNSLRGLFLLSIFTLASMLSAQNNSSFSWNNLKIGSWNMVSVPFDATVPLHELNISKENSITNMWTHRHGKWQNGYFDENDDSNITWDIGMWIKIHTGASSDIFILNTTGKRTSATIGLSYMSTYINNDVANNAWTLLGNPEPLNNNLGNYVMYYYEANATSPIWQQPNSSYTIPANRAMWIKKETDE